MKKLFYFIFFLIFTCFSYAQAQTTTTTTTTHKHKKSHKITRHKKHHYKKHHHSVAAVTTNPAIAAAATVAAKSNPTNSSQPQSDAGEILDNAANNTNDAAFNPITKDSNTLRQPRFYSYSTLSVNAKTGEIYTDKNPNVRLPIASISKLMTAMVTLDSGVDMDGYVTISDDDVDNLRHTYSRLKVGAQYKRSDLLLLALMSSENRAAHALARTSYSGGLKVFIAKMNAKSKNLGMTNTKFYDPTGLNEMNQSTAMDLSKMVHAAFNYRLIRQDTTTKGSDFYLSKKYIHRYINSDSLVRSGKFNIEVSKTGFINEAGHCLVLYVMVDSTPVIMVFLNSSGKNGRILDAIATKNYIRKIM